MSDDGAVTTTTSQAVGTIEFSHPKSNSLPSSLLADMISAIESLAADDSVRVIVLRSAGKKTFCAGASFDEFLAASNTADAQAFFSGISSLILAMKQCPKFIVGRVHGKAVGGGVGIVAAMDYALAIESASVRLSELAIGIGPFTVGPAVERKVGRGVFGRMAISANWFDASWAHQHHLYDELHPSITALDQALDELTTRLAGSSPQAMTAMKKMLWADTDDWETLLAQRVDIVSDLLMTDYARQKVADFKSGRKL